MRVLKGFSVFFCLVGLLIGTSTAYGQSANADPQAYGKGYPERVGQLPASELKDALLALDPRARANAMKKLKNLYFTTLDFPYIKVDENGDIYFVDDFGLEPDEVGFAPLLPPVGEALTETQTFQLHSRPGSPNVIYLDFNGHTFANTAWGTGPYYGRAYDTSGDDSPPWGTDADCTSGAPSVTVNFSTTELARVHEIWHRVAEDYAPFNVDVTTEEPAAFNPYTGRILFTSNYDYCGNPMPSYTAGGVAYLDVWGDFNYHTYYSPALVYNSGIVSAAEAGSHELGHNLSLGHDGTTSATYYSGHGINSDPTSWAPIMGVGYYKNVTQWSKGDYSAYVARWDPTKSYYQETDDDLAEIEDQFDEEPSLSGQGYVADDHADSIAAGPTALEIQGDGTIVVTNPESDPSNASPVNKGVIENRNDVDFFYFDTGAGDISIIVEPAWVAFYPGTSNRGANLDIYAELYDGAGSLVTSDGPSDETDAILVATGQPAGRYYVAIDGEGCVAGCAHEGYDDYASIGQYYISGTVQPVGDDPDPPSPAPTFASGPTATGPHSMTMTSTVATDESGPVEYQFNCTTGGAGCVTSDWQTGTTYNATGLDSKTTYWWQVRARDNAVPSRNLTAYSATSSATTHNEAPTASFTHSTYSLDASLTDTSTDSDGSIVGWDWDFGDGNTSTLQNPTHTYAASGTYNVSLTVTDNDAETDIAMNPVTVMEDTTPPVITILGDNPVFVDQYEPYTDAGATANDDLDGDLTGSISTTGLPVNTDTPGDYTVTYSATDGSGNTGSDNRTVTVVANQAPTAGFSTSNTLLQVTFTDTSTDTDGTVDGWSWDFGDGDGSTQQNPVHTYADYGTYTVSLTATDDDGASDGYSASVEVAPDLVAPVITLLGANPESVNQYDVYSEPGYTANDDVDGDITVNVVVGGWDYDTSTPGVKSLTYDVSDASGNPAVQETRTVTVIANQDPTADFSYVIAGLSVDFTDLSSDVDGTVDAWSWDFGDGNTSTAQNPTHVYASDGAYTVTLTVTDDDGHANDGGQSFTLISPPSGLVAIPDGIDEIELTWSDNSSAETGFEIERVPGGSGSWTTIGSVGPGVSAFVDTSDLTDGADYEYRVRANGPSGDSSWSATAGVTTFDCASTKSFNGGEWYQFALACDPGAYNTVRQVFDSPQPLVYRWDASAMSYVQLGPSDTMTPQVGYWVNFFFSNSFTQSGYANSNADISLATHATEGRDNLVGFHGTGAVAWPDVLVVDGAQTKTLLEADPWENGPNPTNRVCDLSEPTNKCLMSRMLRIWGGTKAAGAYQVYDPDVPGQEGSLVPLDGLWVNAFKAGIQLRLPDPTAPAPGAVEMTDSLAGDGPKEGRDKNNKGGKGGKGDGNDSGTSQWFVRLVAESGDLRDPGNTLGQKPGSLDGRDSRDLEEPSPFLGDFLSVLFTNPLFEPVEWGITTDFRASADTPAGEWPFVVRTSEVGSVVTLSWTADGYDFTNAWLIDEQSGQRIAVVADSEYAFQAEAEESRFVFIIE